MNIREFKFNPNDGRKRERDAKPEPKPRDNRIQERIEEINRPPKEINLPAKEIVEIKEIETTSQPPFPTFGAAQIITEHTQKFIPTRAPPVPTNAKVQNLADMTGQRRTPTPQLDTSFKNVENVTRMEDGRVYVTRVYKSYEDAFEAMDATRLKMNQPPQTQEPPKQESCNFCGKGLLKQGYTMVCPYCHYVPDKV
jgi:hypothetical protein